ncbi:hypothetical protein B0H10DRAFT_2091255, partial [Mycena sp. CBHHK59/15]
IVTFTWEVSAELHITPGQAIIMDMAPLVGVPAYRHMAPSKPTSIRTWTVSSAHGAPGPTRTYALTMREKPGGAVTGPLFAITRKLAEVQPEALADARWLSCVSASSASRRHERLCPPGAGCGRDAPVASGGDAPQEAALDRGRDQT